MVTISKPARVSNRNILPFLKQYVIQHFILSPTESQENPTLHPILIKITDFTLKIFQYSAVDVIPTLKLFLEWLKTDWGLTDWENEKLKELLYAPTKEPQIIF